MGTMNAAIAPSSDVIQQLQNITLYSYKYKINNPLTIDLFHNVYVLFPLKLKLLEWLGLYINIAFVQ